MGPQTAIDAVFIAQGVDGVIDPDGAQDPVRLLIDGGSESNFLAERPVQTDGWRIKVRKADADRVSDQIVVIQGERRRVTGPASYDDRFRLVASYRTAKA